MARRITGACASPGATWGPPRAARRLSGSPVSSLRSFSPQSNLIVRRRGYSSASSQCRLIEDITPPPPCSCSYVTHTHTQNKLLFQGGDAGCFLHVIAVL